MRLKISENYTGKDSKKKKKKGQSIILVIPRPKKKMLGQMQSLETKTGAGAP